MAVVLRSPIMRSVPVGRVIVDPTHPLANGLIGCWLPGLSGGVNLAAGGGPDLTPDTAFTRAVSQDGPAQSSTVANMGLYGLAAPNFKTWANSAFSMAWRGILTGAGNPGFTDMIGIGYDSAGNTPFYVASLIHANAFAALTLRWNQGGTSVVGTISPSGVTALQNTMISAAGTFKVGGNALLYINGLLNQTDAFGAAIPTNTATSRVVIGTWGGGLTRAITGSTNIGCMWNRELSADEMKAWDADPYGFLIPVEAQIPVLYAVAPAYIFTIGQDSNLPTTRMVGY